MVSIIPLFAAHKIGRNSSKTNHGIYRYNALAGIADPSNSLFIIPVVHFPWSDKGLERRGKVNNDQARADQAV